MLYHFALFVEYFVRWIPIYVLSLGDKCYLIFDYYDISLNKWNYVHFIRISNFCYMKRLN